MIKEEFFKIRRKPGKPQMEMALLLAISIKTVKNYEQDLRSIPVNVERIISFILFKLNVDKFTEMELCWDKKSVLHIYGKMVCPGWRRRFFKEFLKWK